MIPLYTPEEFDNAKNETLLPLKCKNCGNTFYLKKHYVWAGINGKEAKNYCSLKCGLEFRNPLVKVVCHTCGKEFEKKSLTLKDKNFCCRSCANKYSSNINKEKKTANQKIWANSDIGKKKLSENLYNRKPNSVYTRNKPSTNPTVCCVTCNRAGPSCATR